MYRQTNQQITITLCPNMLRKCICNIYIILHVSASMNHYNAYNTYATPHKHVCVGIFMTSINHDQRAMNNAPFLSHCTSY